MQTTTEVGINRRGMVVAADSGEKMLQTLELTKPPRGDETDLAKIRLEYAKEAGPLGSLPEPKQSGATALLMD